MELLFIVLGLTSLGSGVLLAAWLGARRRAVRAEIARGASEREAARAFEELGAAREELAALRAEREAFVHLEDEKRSLEETQRETFEALAGRVLKTSSEQFLELAATRMEASGKQAAGDLEKKEQAIRAMVDPLAKRLEELGESTQRLEVKREKAYGELSSRLESLGTATRELLATSSALSSALKGSSQARGRWGEIALRNIVELAGMTEHCDFEEQTQDARGQRPDLIVRLPGGGIVPVDAKVPFVEFERAAAAEDPAERKAHLKAHAAALRAKVKELSTKDYAAEQAGEGDFTVMFVPSEAMLSAAFEVEPGLQEEALGQRILVATPVTLVALLRTVSIYWRQQRMADNAREVWAAGQELYERVALFAEHLGGVGKGLEASLKAYNKAAGTYSRRVAPSGRRLGELGAESGKRPIAPMDEIDGTPRAIEGISAADEE